MLKRNKKWRQRKEDCVYRGRRREAWEEEAWRGGGAWRGSLSSRGRGNKVSHQGNERGGPAGGGSCGNRGISHVRRRRRSPAPQHTPLIAPRSPQKWELNPTFRYVLMFYVI